jgi:hypothetical protein
VDHLSVSLDQIVDVLGRPTTSGTDSVDIDEKAQIVARFGRLP